MSEENPSTETEPVPAASVVLIRDASHGPEILLLRRHAGSSDFAGASVFPGGTLEPEDTTPRLAAKDFPAKRRARLLGRDLTARRARAVHVAACRELFEEAGILLATEPFRPGVSREVLSRLLARRLDLQAGTVNLPDLLRPTGLVLSLEALVPLARWVTPVVRPNRWDTWFFLAHEPANQDALADGRETTEHWWVSPTEALEAYRRGDHVLFPPTYRMLEDLSSAPDATSALRAARELGPLEKVLPVPLAGAKDFTFLYPGDREYPESTSTNIDRLVLLDGKWKSVRS